MTFLCVHETITSGAHPYNETFGDDMPENDKLEIEKIQIADVHSDELTETEQEKITGGGGGYGFDNGSENG